MSVMIPFDISPSSAMMFNLLPAGGDGKHQEILNNFFQVYAYSSVAERFIAYSI